ncbi:phosphate ABC transporter substrate-binding protein PstS [Alloscardovia criceti]|uniref:phosphate ABC transporter substrate-binding protein PstS n=1 Tax=Alloscardovia criceti TaxID=356828 RepID=UPI000687B800|nr:phosphate ABC transporter substrate-binding protein PstS [Alloscardovia criceti]
MLVGASVFSLAACGDNVPSSSLTEASWSATQLEHLEGEFAAAGASSQKSAVDAWIVGFSAAQPDTAISYDPSGSGAGVNTFLTGAIAWAGTDSPLSDEQLEESADVCAQGTAFEVPAYVSPIALAYNLSDYGLEDNAIQMSPQTIAKVFQGKITMWNDPEIQAENPSIAAQLPELEITPVWRSDKSGTTKTFQKYLHAAAPEVWTSEPTETWPNSVGQGAKGTPSVVMTIGQAQGTIGYADYAQIAGLGAIAVKVGDSYVAPSPDATAKLIENSPLKTDIEGENRYVVDVDYATEVEGVYPIALVSYDVACQTYKSHRTATFVKQWLTYVLSDAGQKIAQDNAGSAALPSALRQQMMTTVDSITSEEAQ